MFQYNRIRIALMTFALGLASVWVIDGGQYGPVEIPIHLPQASSTDIFVIRPTRGSEIQIGSGSGGEQGTGSAQIDHGGAGASGGVTCDEARSRMKNKKTKIPNCD